MANPLGPFFYFFISGNCCISWRCGRLLHSDATGFRAGRIITTCGENFSPKLTGTLPSVSVSFLRDPYVCRDALEIPILLPQPLPGAHAAPVQAGTSEPPAALPLRPPAPRAPGCLPSCSGRVLFFLPFCRGSCWENKPQDPSGPPSFPGRVFSRQSSVGRAVIQELHYKTATC